MKNWIALNLLFVAASFLPQTAIADWLAVDKSGSSTLVMISGSSDGVADEVYSTLSQANRLVGNRISSSVEYFRNGPRYQVSMTIDDQSGFSLSEAGLDGEKSLVLTGNVAAELYGDLVQAGLTKTFEVDGNRVDGTHVSCFVLFSGHAHYSCSLEVHN